MNLKQARQRLTRLGFNMDSECKKWGTRELTEDFDFSPNHLLSVPYRDVFIGKSADGYYIASHIRFRGRLYRHRSYNADWMSYRNIFASGHALGQAVAIFENQFRANEQLNAPRTKA